MAVACLSLFVALTGTSVAVVNALPANSVGTAQLKNDAVVSSKIKDGSIRRANLAAGVIPAAKSIEPLTVIGYGAWGTTISIGEADCPTGMVATGGSIAVYGRGADHTGTTGQTWFVSAPGVGLENGETPRGYGGLVQNLPDKNGVYNGEVQAKVYATCVSP